MTLVVVLTSSLCAAQTYPAKPIRLIAAYPAGGPSDIVARAVAQRVGEVLGQSILVENRAGAGGNVGFEAGAKAPPDGYTLLLGAGAMTIAPAIYPKLGYDVVRDLAPIALVASSTFVLMVHPAVPASSPSDLIRLARARPGVLNVGSAGLGSPPHLAAELFQSMAKIKIVHLPYKGATPALTALLGGETDLYFGGISSAVPHVQSARLRGLAVTSRKRASALPNLPTLDASGLKGFDISTWFGLMAPMGTPAEIIQRVHAATVKAIARPEMQQTLLSLGFEPEPMTPEQFSAHVKAELKKFADIVKASGAKFE
jgi:tripartite-type tricarboxylate transporter receptor subunit TctC